MLPRRGVYWLPPCGPGDNVRRPAGNPVVLISVNMKLQINQPQSRLSLVLEDQMSVGNDRLAEAGSPTEAVPHQLGFLPTSGRLLKSESEDSGMELASGDPVPLTPVESEKSFSLDCLDGDDSAPAIQDGFPKEKPEALLPILDCAWQDFRVKRKLGDVVQRSQKNLVSMPKKPPPDLEELKSCYPPCQPVSVEGVLEEANSGGNTLEEKKAKEEAQQTASRPMPGPGLRSLENLSKMMEKSARLQKANMEIRREQEVLECRVRTLESRVSTLGQEKCVNSGSVEGVLDEASGEGCQATSGGSILEEEKTKEEAQQRASSPRTGPGLHYLENLCRMLDKMAKLQKANLEIHHKCQILERRIRTLEQEKNDRSLWGKLKGLFTKMRRKSVMPEEVIQVAVTRNSSSDITSQSRHLWHH